MSLQTQITSAFQRVRDEFNTIKGIRGLLANLTTTDKSSLVSAINEVNTKAGNAAVINDTTASLTEVYSSTKTDAQIATAVANLIDSAPGALDTLNELATAITANDGDIASAIADIASNDTDIAALQTEDAAIRTDYGDHTYDFVSDFTTGLN